MANEFLNNQEIFLSKAEIYTLCFSTLSITQGRSGRDIFANLFQYVHMKNPEWRIDSGILDQALEQLSGFGDKTLQDEKHPLLKILSSLTSKRAQKKSNLPHSSYRQIREKFSTDRKISDKDMRAAAMEKIRTAMETVFSGEPQRALTERQVLQIFYFLLETDDEYKDGRPARMPGEGADSRNDIFDPWLSYVCRYIMEERTEENEKAVKRFGPYADLFSIIRGEGIIERLIQEKKEKKRQAHYNGTDTERNVNTLRRVLERYLTHHPERIELFSQIDLQELGVNLN